MLLDSSPPLKEIKSGCCCRLSLQNKTKTTRRLLLNLPGKPDLFLRSINLHSCKEQNHQKQNTSPRTWDTSFGKQTYQAPFQSISVNSGSQSSTGSAGFSWCMVSRNHRIDSTWSGRSWPLFVLTGIWDWKTFLQPEQTHRFCR